MPKGRNLESELRKRYIVAYLEAVGECPKRPLERKLSELEKLFSEARKK